jgi:hypothetical protein
MDGIEGRRRAGALAERRQRALYISPDSKMMSVEVNSQPAFQAGNPQPLFQTDMLDTGIRTGPISWDLAPDGNRFLIITANTTDGSSLRVALNWLPVLKK